MKIYTLEYNSLLDCGHRETKGVTTSKERAEQWEALGYGYEYREWEEDQADK